MFAAIPTTYAGVNFRSRLEAKWATFFDICKWPWQYEPFDLNGWIPDFVIGARYPMLVEIKPYMPGFEPGGMGERMIAAVAGTEWETRDMVLLGAGPSMDWSESKTYQRYALGIIREYNSDRSDDWQPALAGVYSGGLDFCPAYGEYTGRIFGEHHQWPGGGNDALSRLAVHGQWARATNWVQWKGAR